MVNSSTTEQSSTIEVQILHDGTTGELIVGKLIKAQRFCEIYEGILQYSGGATIDVVVKRVHNAPLATREERAFRRIEQCRSGGHPMDHVVRCYGIAQAGTEHGYTYFVLEPALGDVGDLEVDGLARADLAWSVLVGGLRALVELKPTGVVSRDLHPGNFLVRHEPNPAAHDVMITDFGHAWFPEAPKTVGDTRGILCVQPKDLATSGRPPEGPDDAYSVAVSAFMMLTPVVQRRLPLMRLESPLWFNDAELDRWSTAGKPNLAYIRDVKVDLRTLHDPLGPDLESAAAYRPELSEALTLLIAASRGRRRTNLERVGQLVGIPNLADLARTFVDIPPPVPVTPAPTGLPRNGSPSADRVVSYPVVLPSYLATLADFRVPRDLATGANQPDYSAARGGLERVSSPRRKPRSRIGVSASAGSEPEAGIKTGTALAQEDADAKASERTQATVKQATSGSSKDRSTKPSPHGAASNKGGMRSGLKAVGGVALTLAIIALLLVAIPYGLLQGLSALYRVAVPEVAWDRGGWHLWPQWTTAGLAILCYLTLLLVIFQSLFDDAPPPKPKLVLLVVAVLTAGSLAYPAVRGSATVTPVPIAATAVRQASTDCTGSVLGFNQPTSLVCWHLGGSWQEAGPGAGEGTFPQLMGWTSPSPDTTKPQHLWTSATASGFACQTVYAQVALGTMLDAEVPSSFTAKSGTGLSFLAAEGSAGHLLYRAFNDQTYLLRGGFTPDGTTGVQMYQRRVVQRHGLQTHVTPPGPSQTQVQVYVVRANCSPDEVSSADQAVGILMGGLAVNDHNYLDESLLLRSADLGKVTTTPQHITIPIASDVTPMLGDSQAFATPGVLAQASVGLSDSGSKPTVDPWADVRVLTGTAIPSTATSSSHGWLTEPVTKASWSTYLAPHSFYDLGAATKVDGVQSCSYKLFNDDHGQPLTVRACLFTGTPEASRYTTTFDNFLGQLTVGAGPAPKGT